MTGRRRLDIPRAAVLVVLGP